MRAIVSIASESLRGGLERWRERGWERDDGAAVTVLAYLIRSASRATPFAACATIGLVGVGNSTREPVTVERTFRRHTRPDAAFTYAFASALEQRPEIFGRLRLADSGCSHLVNGRLEVADFARTELHATGDTFAAAFLTTALNETRAVVLARRLCAGTATAADVAQEMSATLGATIDDCLGLLRELVRLGVLITELRVPPVAERGAMLLASLERVAPDPASAFASVLAEIAHADAVDLPAAPDRYDRAAAGANALLTADHWRQLDSTRTYAGSLGTGVVSDLETVLTALTPLARSMSTNAAIASAFLEKYAVGREIPLLALLDQSDGLAFERALETTIPDTSIADAALLEIAVRAVRDGLASIELDAIERERLAQPRPSGRYPSHVEALCHVGRSADGADRVVLFTGAHAGAHLTLGRFHPDLTVDPTLEPADPDTIEVELSILPHSRRSGNVVGRRAGVEFELVCGVCATRPADRVITLDDLVVGVHDDRVYVRSLRLGASIRVVQHDVANTMYVSRIAQFFEAIFAPDLRYIGFTWGAYAGSLPFTPRVTVGAIAVTPAIWRLPKRVAEQMESATAKEWCASWRVPRYVYLVDADNRLLLDRDHALCRAIVEREAARLDDRAYLEFHEALPYFGDGIPGADGGEYFAEAAVSFRSTFAEQRPVAGPSGARARPARNDRLRPLGSDWIYAKLYIGAPRASYFLERSIPDLLAGMDPDIDLFHFLRYADPAHHVRVRFRVIDAAHASRSRERAIRFVERLTADGIVDGAVWDVYDREIERYGGLGSIETAERIFDADSRALLDALRAFRISDDSTRDILRDIADFTASLSGEERQALEILRTSIGGRRDRLTAKQWTAVRAARQAPHSARYHRLPALGERLRETADTDPSEIVRTLVHMHCNRLGLSPLEEGRAMHLVAAIFEGDVARYSR